VPPARNRPLAHRRFHTWIKLGRAVRKGEQAIRILAPIAIKQREPHIDGTEDRRVFFKTTFVFDTLSRVWPSWR
jgi:hypothetical protein